MGQLVLECGFGAGTCLTFFHSSRKGLDAQAASGHLRSGPMCSALSLPHLQDPKTAAMTSILKTPAVDSGARDDSLNSGTSEFRSGRE